MNGPIIWDKTLRLHDAWFIVLFHIAAELLGDLFEHLGRKVTSLDGVFEANKLNDVALNFLTIGTQTTTIAVEHLHRAEVCVADTDDDD